uniref:UPF3 domain-containing protein n=1 Tax=Glossina brevipalpis TaxID=37001 RepID=A0A1A9W996_9MUSC
MAKDEKSSTKSQKHDHDHDNKMKLPNKVIIRHLPPNMTEDDFLKQTDPLPDYDFYYFAAADWSLGSDATCRAYITFKNHNDIFLFRDRFDGYVFVDNRGNEYPAVVEFAPFQGVLKNKSRGGDSKVNTIEQESHYQQFLKKLEEEREAIAKGSECKLEFPLDRKKEEIASTPLLQYLANKKEKRREEAKKRTQEKKRQREEEQQKQQQQSEQNSHQKQTDGKNGKDINASSKQQTDKEEIKSSRQKSKNDRRAERNRRRAEEFKKRLEDHQNSHKRDEQAEKKEHRRNRRDKEKEKEKGKSSDLGRHIEILKKHNTTELNESVRNFIYQAAHNLAVKPQEGTEEKTNDEAVQKNENAADMIADDDLKIAQEKLNKMNIKEELKTQNLVNKEGNESTISEENKTSQQKQQQKEKDKREEKRIRNKVSYHVILLLDYDRPSIAIYQPKQRLRLSEESDTNSNSRDARSQPTSDCEVVNKKEDQSVQQQPRNKKVPRYSERARKRQKPEYKESRDKERNYDKDQRIE